jgi:hypothetical protein
MPLPQKRQRKVTLTSVFENYTVYVFKLTLHPLTGPEELPLLREYAFWQRKLRIRNTLNSRVPDLSRLC